MRLGLTTLAALAALVAAPPASSSVILWDQYNSPSTIATSSQNYETAFNAYDDEAADDFIVSQAQGWLVNQVEVDGQYFNGPGPATSVNIHIYADGAGNLPGNEVASRLNATFTQGPEYGDFVIPLNPGIPLGPGTYWISVQANQIYSTTGQWGWTDKVGVGQYPAAWRNPGNGFGLPSCIPWAQRGSTCGIDPPAPDQVYRLLGNIGAGGPSLIHDQTTVYDQNGNGYLEPGETFQLDERVRNTGGETATNVSSVLSTTTTGISLNQPNSTYPDIPAGINNLGNERTGKVDPPEGYLPKSQYLDCLGKMRAVTIARLR